MKSSPVREEKFAAWSVGELAQRFDLPTHVLRYWEEQGLLSPQRDAGGRRRFGHDDLARVAIIVRNKAAGMTLAQIRVLLDAESAGRHTVLEEHLADLERRMRDMEQSRAMTLHALECQAHDITTCPNFRAAVQDVIDGTAFPSGHLA
ncbi:MerR family transcriptional regulator [Ornithinimicrobium faecis]|uniref:MerR family transcriptional regulator n=1 Tax=Ornithinimicrobium faecis TaxID=2934158 RepID=A0ABY4YPJ3_9MICO|nr:MULTISPECIES: MerR family transcriptional regulator [unclassified Ornithinimicrobium]USQ78676.1 MerR family transcriptional regulator [Ornithinimicrobium sp. HY1793]